jgi:hypothetical protein
LGIITTPLICLGIITVLIFGDYYVAFWGLLLSSISGIIQATQFIHFVKNKSADVCYESGHFLPPRKN